MFPTQKKPKEEKLMTVSFEPPVIYKNAFYFSQQKKLLKRDIVRFCGLLRKEITKNPNYERVYLNDFDESELKSFYDAYWGIFHEIDKTVYFNQTLTEKDIESVNRDYDQYVKLCLKKVGQNFLLKK